MIQRPLKLRLTAQQERQLTDWLWHLTGVWNWAIRKLELDARDGLYYSPKDFHNLLANHGKTLGIPSHTLQGMLTTAYTAWQRCFKKLAQRPRLKGQRNKLTSIPFPDPLKAPVGNTIGLPGIGRVRFHKQAVPDGRIKMGRLVKRASGWYLCLCIDATPQAIPHTGEAQVGIDPGFHHLLTLSSGEKIPRHCVGGGALRPFPIPTNGDRPHSGSRRHNVGAESTWRLGCKSGSRINAQTATINSRAVWLPNTRPSCGPRMVIEP